MAITTCVYVMITFSIANLVHCSESYTRTFSIPLRVFDGNHTYVCVAQPISADQFIVQYEPRVHRDVIKHMGFSLCDEPYSTVPMWDCLQPHTVCKHRREPLYPWSNYAPGCKFSANAGMYTGNRPRYLVFQIHGPDKAITRPEADNVGSMAVTLTSSKPEYNVAIFVVGNDGHIPPNVKDYKTDSSCLWNISRPARIFGYALHTHLKGKTAAGYIIRNGKWIEIGKGDPRYPVTFFDMTHKHIHLQKGDRIAVRCTFDNPTSHYIKFGLTEEDEMCNFFIYYSTTIDAPKEDRSYMCSNDAMTYHWEDNLQGIPSDSTDISGDTDQRLFANTHKDFILRY